jgi:outer membrane protein assembly factor BamB
LLFSVAETITVTGMSTLHFRIGGVVFLATLAMAVASAEDHWPRFRGAQGGVSADDPRLPDVWGPSQNIVWQIDLPGRSWSSPVVWGDHIFVTTAINTVAADTLLPVSAYVARSGGGTMTFRDIAEPAALHRFVLYDIDFKTGRIRWERDLAKAVPARSRHLKNSYASETPVTDGERIYAYFGHLGLFALDLNGTLLWSKPMRAYDMQTGFGTAKSPVVDDERVYIVDDNEQQSFIAAYDKVTGEEVWRVDRKESSNWTTPYVWKNERRTEIVTAATGGIRSYGVDGKLLWQLSGMSTFAVPSPFAADGLLYVMSGYPTSPLRPTYAIQPGALGDISLQPDQTSNEYVVWSHPTLGTFHPSSLVYGGCYYTLHDRGFLTCNDPRTGKEIYPRQRISVDSTGFTASPWAYNGKLFALSEDGDTYVIQAGREFRVLRKNSLNEMTLATPAIANGSLIIRTASKLYRIGNSN